METLKENSKVTVSVDLVTSEGRGLVFLKDKIMIIEDVNPEEKVIRVNIVKIQKETIIATKASSSITQAQPRTATAEEDTGPYSIEGEENEEYEEEESSEGTDE